MKKLIILLLSLLCLFACSKEETYFKSKKELDGKKIGILTGSIYDKPVRRIYQESTYSDYPSVDELTEALLDKKIDAFVIERPIAIICSNETDGVTYIDESVIPGDVGFVFSRKKENLLNQFNKFIEDSKENGYMDYLDKKWFTPNGAKQFNDSYILNGKNGTINAITSTDLAPFSFVNNGVISGFEVDLLLKFCYENGYKLNIESKNFNEVLENVNNETYDIGFASIMITNDRKKEYLMSDPIYDNYGVFVVRERIANKESEFKSLADIDGHSIGVLNDSIYEDSIRDAFEKPQISFCPSRSAAIEALRKKEIDGYIIEEPFAMSIVKQYDDLAYIHEPVEEIDYAYIFSSEKKDVLDQFNDFVKKSKTNGYIDYLNNKWFSSDSGNFRNNIAVLTGENGTLKVATSSDSVPFSFNVNGDYHGYEVELFNQFCFEYGYNYVITNETFSSSLSSVQANKYDVVFNSIGITPERKSKYLMSNPVYSCPGVIVTRCAK